MTSAYADTDEFVSPALLAKWWQVNPRTIIRWGEKSGCYSVFRQGDRIVRINRQDALDFMNNCYQRTDAADGAPRKKIEWGDSELLTVSQVANILDISTRTVLRWIHARRISHFVFSPKTYRISSKDILINKDIL